jgi:hypothetical protein
LQMKHQSPPLWSITPMHGSLCIDARWSHTSTWPSKHYQVMTYVEISSTQQWRSTSRPICKWSTNLHLYGVLHQCMGVFVLMPDGPTHQQIRELVVNDHKESSLGFVTLVTSTHNLTHQGMICAFRCKVCHLAATDCCATGQHNFWALTM